MIKSYDGHCELGHRRDVDHKAKDQSDRDCMIKAEIGADLITILCAMNEAWGAEMALFLWQDAGEHFVELYKEGKIKYE